MGTKSGFLPSCCVSKLLLTNPFIFSSGVIHPFTDCRVFMARKLQLMPWERSLVFTMATRFEDMNAYFRRVRSSVT